MPIPRSAARPRFIACLRRRPQRSLAFPGAASAAVTSNVTAGVLSVESDAADAIAITCVANDVQVNGADPDDGQADCDAIVSIGVTARRVGQRDHPGRRDQAAFGAADAQIDVEVDGGDGNDTITGSEFDDDLFGGGDDDRIIGDNNPAGTRDNSVGGDGDDTLVWNPGDGDDTNEGGAGTDTIEVNGGGGGEQFTVAPGDRRADRVRPHRPDPARPVQPRHRHRRAARPQRRRRRRHA